MNELGSKNIDRTDDKEMYADLKRRFDEEMSKPLRKRDLERVGRLAVQLDEMSGNEPFNVSRWTDKLYDRIESRENKRKMPMVSVMRRSIPVLCCAVVILVANCITVAAWDMNILSVVVEFTKGGFSVDFAKSNKNEQEGEEENEELEEIILPVSEDDPYGIIGECAKYDIYSVSPFYLPDGFKLTGTEHNENKQATSMIFNFFNGKKTISIAYDFYFDTVGQIGIPSDYYNISETEVNGCPAIVSKEDNQFTITFVKDNTVFLMFTQDVPYDECEKIVKSIK